MKLAFVEVPGLAEKCLPSARGVLLSSFFLALLALSLRVSYEGCSHVPVFCSTNGTASSEQGQAQRVSLRSKLLSIRFRVFFRKEGGSGKDKPGCTSAGASNFTWELNSRKDIHEHEHQWPQKKFFFFEVMALHPQKTDVVKRVAVDFDCTACLHGADQNEFFFCPPTILIYSLPLSTLRYSPVPWFICCTPRLVIPSSWAVLKVGWRNSNGWQMPKLLLSMELTMSISTLSRFQYQLLLFLLSFFFHFFSFTFFFTFPSIFILFYFSFLLILFNFLVHIHISLVLETAHVSLLVKRRHSHSKNLPSFVGQDALYETWRTVNIHCCFIPCKRCLSGCWWWVLTFPFLSIYYCLLPFPFIFLFKTIHFLLCFHFFTHFFVYLLTFYQIWNTFYLQYALYTKSSNRSKIRNMWEDYVNCVEWSRSFSIRFHLITLLLFTLFKFRDHPLIFSFYWLF